MDHKKTTQKRLVVVGNGMAGIAAIETILKTNVKIPITLFGAESALHYNRILLTEVLSGKSDVEKIVIHRKDWYEAYEIDFRKGVSVKTIDPENKSVCDETGAVVSYDYLLLATGSLPAIPPIKGHRKKGVYTFWTLEDTERIISEACVQREAVVIGGGLLGLEAARALINYGVSVTLVHLSDRLMERQLDPAGASLLKQQIEQMGIRVLLETTAEKIVGNGRVTGLRLKTGEVLPAGMAIIATGNRPNTKLAKEAGLKVNQGIVVDDRLETSIPGIFALGDVIEHRGRTYGLIAPLKEQAQVLSDVVLGKDQKRYEGSDCATTLKVAGICMTSAGELIRKDGAEELSFLDTEKGIYKKGIIRQNRLTGYILLGDNKTSARLFSLMKNKEDISSIKSELFGRVGSDTGNGKGMTPSSGVSNLSDTDLVCNCNNVTKGQIVGAIREKGLKTCDAVAACTEATTGCGSCSDLIEDILLEVSRPAKTLLPTVSKKQLKGSSLKTLDLEQIKKEGLGIDFSKITEMGSLAVSVADQYRLKTYGFCVQKHTGYSMVRIRISGGLLTQNQVVQLAALAEIHGRGQIHLTVRQSIELHWVRLEEANPIFDRLRSMGLTSRSACGHTLRNVMACSHGAISPDGILDVQALAAQTADFFIARSDLINPTMPNRLNLFFSGCKSCAAEAMINDIGFAAVRRMNNDQSVEVGFEMWVGGSLGAHPKLGYKLRSFLPMSEILPACQTVFEIHTQFGNRNKARSRLKFLIEQWGIDAFKEKFDKIFLEKKGGSENLKMQMPLQTETNNPSWGKRLWTKIRSSKTHKLVSGAALQRQNGFVRLTVSIPLGEISSERFISLWKIAKQYGNGQFYLTQNQDIELHWVPVSKISRVVKRLKEIDLELKGSSGVPNILSCVGIEFCTLAVTHAQGAAKDLLNHYLPMQAEKRDLLRSISVHISGCPNSCAKHQAAEIGLAGTMLPVGDARRYSYQLYLGGSTKGRVMLGEMVRKGITEEMVIPTIDALLDVVLRHRIGAESFNEVIWRLGPKAIAEQLEEKIAPFVPKCLEEVEMTPDLLEVLPL